MSFHPSVRAVIQLPPRSLSRGPAVVDCRRPSRKAQRVTKLQRAIGPHWSHATSIRLRRSLGVANAWAAVRVLGRSDGGFAIQVSTDRPVRLSPGKRRAHLRAAPCGGLGGDSSSAGARLDSVSPISWPAARPFSLDAVRAGFGSIRTICGVGKFKQCSLPARHAMESIGNRRRRSYATSGRYVQVCG
jgi:hypothetical protein